MPWTEESLSFRNRSLRRESRRISRCNIKEKNQVASRILAIRLQIEPRGNQEAGIVWPQSATLLAAIVSY